MMIKKPCSCAENENCVCADCGRVWLHVSKKYLTDISHDAEAMRAKIAELEAEVAELWGSAKDLLNACDQVDFSHDGEYPVRAHRMARLRKALAHTPASRTELQAARDRVVEAAKNLVRYYTQCNPYHTCPTTDAVPALEKLENGNA